MSFIAQLKDAKVFENVISLPNDLAGIGAAAGSFFAFCCFVVVFRPPNFSSLHFSFLRVRFSHAFTGMPLMRFDPK